jgi:hypothetical protein
VAAKVCLDAHPTSAFRQFAVVFCPLLSPFADAEHDLPLSKRLKGAILARNIGHLENIG